LQPGRLSREEAGHVEESEDETGERTESGQYRHLNHVSRLHSERREAVPKKTSRKDPAKKQKTSRKLLDLPVKTVKGGDAATLVKGGFIRRDK
jgi:hypothetical protein